MADFSLGNRNQLNGREDLIKELKKSFDKVEDTLKTEAKELSTYWVNVPTEDNKVGRFPNEDEVKRYNGKFLVCRADGEMYVDRFISDKSRYGSSSSFVLIEPNNPVVKWMNLPDI